MLLPRLRQEAILYYITPRDSFAVLRSSLQSHARLNDERAILSLHGIVTTRPRRFKSQLSPRRRPLCSFVHQKAEVYAL